MKSFALCEESRGQRESCWVLFCLNLPSKFIPNNAPWDSSGQIGGEISWNLFEILFEANGGRKKKKEYIGSILAVCSDKYTF